MRGWTAAEDSRCAELANLADRPPVPRSCRRRVAEPPPRRPELVRRQGQGRGAGRRPSARPGSTCSSPTTSCRPASSRRSRSLLNVKVIDRSRLILDIFALHAQTHEGRLQVELAQLEYQLPRLTKLWTHLSRTQGGIGSRGPGESQLETDRRIIRTRISKMKERVEQVRQQRETAARGRDRRLWPTVGIVGYTNAGKSTLLNALVGSEVAKAEDKLFATLDPTSRQVKLGDGQTAIVTDTVGLHPQAAAPARRRVPGDARGGQPGRRADRGRRRLRSPIFEEHRATVQTVLDELGAGDKPRLVAFNKADLLDQAARDGDAPGAGHRRVASSCQRPDRLRAWTRCGPRSPPCSPRCGSTSTSASRTRPASSWRASASAARSSSSTASATSGSAAGSSPPLAGELEAAASRWAAAALEEIEATTAAGP